MLTQHNQEFQPYIPDPPSHGTREGSGNESNGYWQRSVSYANVRNAGGVHLCSKFCFHAPYYHLVISNIANIN